MNNKQVVLKFYPHCTGIIIEIQPRLVVVGRELDKKYKVRWNNPEYGVSGWLSPNDFLIDTGEK